MTCNNYITASFKLIEFEVLGVEYKGGNRVLTHAYPFTDSHYNEDLGDKPERFTVNGCFHGDNFRAKLFLAQKVWETKGAGVFFEPTQNLPHNLKLIDWTYKFDEKKLNYVSFTLTLVEASDDPYTTRLSNFGSIDRTIDELIGAANDASTGIAGLVTSVI